MTERIDRVLPDPASDLDDDELIAGLRRDDPVLRVNFVSSVDGAATREGRSGGLSGAADKRFFELLRRICDVVLVGAGTVRVEGYGGMRVSDESARWRQAQGLPPHPRFAIVSGSLGLDPASPVFADAPVRPLLVTTAGTADADRARFGEVADVVVAGDGARADLSTAVRALREHGLSQILSEGGPTLFGGLLAEDLVDELCLTVSPRLEAGSAPRISTGAIAAPRTLRLATVLESDSTLLLRYARA